MTEFPAEVVEKVARALMERALWVGAFDMPQDARFHGYDAERGTWINRAEAALSALSPAAAAVERGEAVAVPREATDAMIHAGASPDQGFYTKSRTAEFMGVWRRMLAASPFAQEPPRKDAGEGAAG